MFNVVIGVHMALRSCYRRLQIGFWSEAGIEDVSEMKVQCFTSPKELRRLSVNLHSMALRAIQSS